MAKIIYIIKNEGGKKLRELACRGKKSNRIIVSCEQGRESLEAWGVGRMNIKRFSAKHLIGGARVTSFSFICLYSNRRRHASS